VACCVAHWPLSHGIEHCARRHISSNCDHVTHSVSFPTSAAMTAAAEAGAPPSEQAADVAGDDSGLAAASQESWAIRFQNAMNKRLGITADDENDGGEKDETGEGEGTCSAGLEEAAPDVAEPEPEMPFRCFQCRKGFATSEAQAEHLHEVAACVSHAWQAVVNVMLCLPGAGTTLWCPACPDDFVGQWSGPATKAAALIRHCSAAKNIETGHHQEEHSALLRLLVGLLLRDLPTDSSEGSLQEWAASSQLLQAAGPLLAKRSREARRGLGKLESEVLGTSSSAIGNANPQEMADEDGTGEGDAPEEGNEMRLRILGLDLTVDSGASDLYADVDKQYDEMLAQGDGPELPSGGAAALRSFDLTLSSDEEEQPQPTGATEEEPKVPTAPVVDSKEMPSAKRARHFV